MRRLFYIIVLLFIGCASNTTKIISTHPKSIYPPTIRTSFNTNTQLIKPIKKVAIVSINYNSLPDAAMENARFEREWAASQLDEKLERIELWSKSDTILYPYFEEMEKAAQAHADSLFLSTKKEAKTYELAKKQVLKTITYEAYESKFIEHRFNVVERDKLEKVLEEYALSMSGLIDEELALEIGNFVAVDAICLIDVLDVMGEYLDPPDVSLSVHRERFKLISVETGEIILTGMFQNVQNGVDLMFQDLLSQIPKNLDNGE